MIKKFLILCERFNFVTEWKSKYEYRSHNGSAESPRLRRILKFAPVTMNKTSWWSDIWAAPDSKYKLPTSPIKMKSLERGLQIMRLFEIACWRVQILCERLVGQSVVVIKEQRLDMLYLYKTITMLNLCIKYISKIIAAIINCC